MNPRLPDFIIIGAMKCATSTLHDQLAAQPGIFMSTPKEPNFFSDDAQWARGLDWYRALFADAAAGDLCGESSTHYTKLPVHPDTLARMRPHVERVKLIYLMRHPLDRLVSHYVHEWTERTLNGPLDDAVRAAPRLVEYGLYSRQLQPYIDAYGRDAILPVFFERLVAEPQAELERICRFIGYRGRPVWQHAFEQRNASSARMRSSRLRNALLENPLSRQVQQRVVRRYVPQRFRDRVKAIWQMKQRPQLSPALAAELCREFDRDLAVLGRWLGTPLDCDGFRAAVSPGPLDWVGATARTGRPDPVAQHG